MRINLPLKLWLPRKTMDDKLCPMNMNFYRNVHHITNNSIKKMFVGIVRKELKYNNGDVWPLMKGQYRFRYKIFPERKCDIMNIGAVLDKYLCDSLIELGVIKDDNCNVIPEIIFVFGGIDKENPRCELEILRLEG